MSKGSHDKNAVWILIKDNSCYLPPNSCSTLTDADHNGGVDLERIVLVCVALFTEVGPEVALADLRKVLARKGLKYLPRTVFPRGELSSKQMSR